MNKYDKITGFADEISDDLSTQIESLNKLDIHYVEMRGVDGNNLIFHNNEKVKEIRSRLDDAGIALSALGSPLGKIGIEDSFDKHFEDFKRAVEIAHMMDTKNIRMFSFYISDEQRQTRKGEVFDRLGRFVDYASDNDIVLLHENEKGIYGEKAPECLELMKEFAGDHFRAIFDFANFVQCGQDTRAAWELLSPYVEYMHIKDALPDGSVVPAGKGAGNLGWLLSQYKGEVLTVEPHLSVFEGFDKLENDQKTLMRYTYPDSRTAFRAAADALKQITGGQQNG